MKMHASLIALGLVAMSQPAKAEFFACTFTEPFVSVYLSTGSKAATIDGMDMAGRAMITSIKDDGGSITFTFASEKMTKLEIQRSVPGNDGMSDLLFPYTAKWSMLRAGAGEVATLWGGCENEKTDRGTKIVAERISDLRSKGGAVLVNYWPGEYGFVSGFKVKRKATFAPNSTWESVSRSTRSQKSCTVPAGKYFVPSRAANGEMYASLDLARTFKAQEADADLGVKVGDELTLLAYLGEGFCTVEKGSKIGTIQCPSPESLSALEQGTDILEGRYLAPLGDYALTKCQEGHFTWIPASEMRANPKLEYVNLGF